MKRFLIAVPLLFLLSLYGSAQVFSAPNQPTDPAEKAAQNKRIAEEIEALKRERAAHPGAKIQVDDATPQAQVQGDSGAKDDIRKLERDTSGVPGAGGPNGRTNADTLTDAMNADPTVPANQKIQKDTDSDHKSGGNGGGSGSSGNNGNGSKGSEIEHGTKGGGRRD